MTWHHQKMVQQDPQVTTFEFWQRVPQYFKAMDATRLYQQM